MSDTFRDLLYNRQNTAASELSYEDVLRDAREHISGSHADELALCIAERDSAERVQNFIADFLAKHYIRLTGLDIEGLTQRLYLDMAGFGFLEQYIYDDAIEEINGNSWNDIEIVTQTGYRKTPERFASPEQAMDMVKKMVRLGGLVIDNTNPAVDSYLTPRIRISAMIPPIVDTERGVVFSLRKQQKARITREELIASGTASAEMLTFLSLCANHGVSVGIAGKTGSGKTTDISYLLNSVDKSKRIFVIEETRELDIVNEDESGRPLNRVIHTCTRPSELEQADVDMTELLRKSLRFHPDLLVLAEMRGKEAVDVVESARTGHTVLTSLHANSAAKAYTRILSMYQMATTSIPPQVILSFICEAFPIIVFKRQMADGTRRVIEIVEALGVEDGSVRTQTLYRYNTQSGCYERVHPISEALAQTLAENEAPTDKIKQFI
jgi:pilus assembly protein CpaF